ncbi:hypothetical protein BDV25DRAFT_154052 [Aspergillus avenaceus]|uniref:Uncharacterized protein n=1 Tax=Aspergillus avenaceus TaxID=36643 RepID=A0A5N6TW86_ASPAV|nr:hypothetical protein BDV25DRAFT_154052 [Aspergillus avenaceus]
MSQQGRLWDNEHGLHIAAIEAGTGSVTRLPNGGATRFTFKTPFKKTPHVQLTSDFGTNTQRRYVPFQLYLLGNGAPAVDKEGFSVGIYSPVGHTETFRYTAMTILEKGNKPSPGPSKPRAKL